LGEKPSNKMHGRKSWHVLQSVRRTVAKGTSPLWTSWHWKGTKIFLSVSRLQFLCMFGTKMAWPQGRDFLWLWVLILCRQAWSMQWLENAKLILLPSGSLSSSSGAPTTWLTFLAHRDTYSKCHKSKTSDFI
jgi:hypothetical protein